MGCGPVRYIFGFPLTPHTRAGGRAGGQAGLAEVQASVASCIFSFRVSSRFLPCLSSPADNKLFRFACFSRRLKLFFLTAKGVMWGYGGGVVVLACFTCIRAYETVQ